MVKPVNLLVNIPLKREIHMFSFGIVNKKSSSFSLDILISGRKSACLCGVAAPLFPAPIISGFDDGPLSDLRLKCTCA